MLQSHCRLQDEPIGSRRYVAVQKPVADGNAGATICIHSSITRIDRPRGLTRHYLNMNTRPTQELLPATSARPVEEPNLLRWLIAPEPKRFMLPLTGLWILGLDWLIFTQNILLSL